MTNRRKTISPPHPWPWTVNVAHCAWCGRLLQPPHKITGPEHCPEHAAIPIDSPYIPMIQSDRREEATND